MKSIHSISKYRNIAIWYDEFLTPGEDFEKNIEIELNKSSFLALLVTPNIINEKNYIQSIEYPLARKIGKNILPMESIKTNKKILRKLYPGIAKCINAHDETILGRAIFEALKSISFQFCDRNPEQTYLVGLAYIYGVDVEVNFIYGIKLIYNAAMNGCPKAMEKLADMFLSGENVVVVNYGESLKWREKFYQFLAHEKGEKTEKHLFN